MAILEVGISAKPILGDPWTAKIANYDTHQKLLTI